MLNARPNLTNNQVKALLVSRSTSSSRTTTRRSWAATAVSYRPAPLDATPPTHHVPRRRSRRGLRPGHELDPGRWHLVAGCDLGQRLMEQHQLELDILELDLVELRKLERHGLQQHQLELDVVELGLVEQHQLELYVMELGQLELHFVELGQLEWKRLQLSPSLTVPQAEEAAPASPADPRLTFAFIATVAAGGAVLAALAIVTGPNGPCGSGHLLPGSRRRGVAQGERRLRIARGGLALAQRDHRGHDHVRPGRRGPRGDHRRRRARAPAPPSSRAAQGDLQHRPVHALRHGRRTGLRCARRPRGRPGATLRLHRRAGRRGGLFHDQLAPPARHHPHDQRPHTRRDLARRPALAASSDRGGSRARAHPGGSFRAPRLARRPVLPSSHWWRSGRARLYTSRVGRSNQQLTAANADLDQLNSGLLKTLAAVIDARDVYLYGHSVQASKYGDACP